MNFRNHVQLVGNLGKTPDFKTFDNGNTLAKASLAVSSLYRNSQGQQVTDTQWINITAWGKTAERFESLCEKGTYLAVFGKLDAGSYLAKDGTKKFYTQVVVNDFMLMKKISNN